MRQAFLIALGFACILPVSLFAASGAFNLNCTNEKAQTTVLTNVVPVRNNLAVALIPARGFSAQEMECQLSISSQDQQGKSIPCTVLPYRSGMGLTLFKLSTPLPEGDVVKPAPAHDLKRGESIVFYDDQGTAVHGIYIGEEHNHYGVSFIIPLLRVQFPHDQIPPRSKACFSNQGTFVGFVMNSFPEGRGRCYLLPAESVVFFANHPEAGRVRLGCQMDVNSSTPEIVEVIPGGPMDKAGVRPGDILVSLNGKDINEYSDFLKAVHYLPNSKPINIIVIRDTKTLPIRNIIPAYQRQAS